MKAVFQRRFGGPEVLEYGELPDPSPGPEFVGVKVHATSVNHVDVMLRNGQFTFLQGKRFPKVLGAEFAGVVEKVGDGVTAFRPGDRVFGLVDIIKGHDGGNAERVIAGERSVAKLPEGVSFADAGALPVAAGTAWQAFTDYARIGPGSRVLVNGGSGGVGTFAVMLAHALGAHVTAVASGRNADFVRSLGADRHIDYGKADFRSGGERYDLVFDIVGNAPYFSCRKVLADGGVWVTTVPSPRAFAERAASKLFRHKAFVSEGMKATPLLPALARFFIEKNLKIAVEKTLPLSELAEAHRLADTGRTRGKILISVAAQGV